MSIFVLFSGICGNIIIVTSEPSQFFSPEYRNAYPRNTFCQWIIRAPAGSSIAVVLDEFELQSDADMLLVRFCFNLNYFCGHLLSISASCFLFDSTAIFKTISLSIIVWPIDFIYPKPIF